MDKPTPVGPPEATGLLTPAPMARPTTPQPERAQPQPLTAIPVVLDSMPLPTAQPGSVPILPVQIQVVPATSGSQPIALTTCTRAKILATTPGQIVPATQGIIFTKVQPLLGSNVVQIRPGILQPKTAKVLTLTPSQLKDTPLTLVSATKLPLKLTTVVGSLGAVSLSRPNIIRAATITVKPVESGSTSSSSSRRKTVHMPKEDPSHLEKPQNGPPIEVENKDDPPQPQLKGEAPEMEAHKQPVPPNSTDGIEGVAKPKEDFDPLATIGAMDNSHENPEEFGFNTNEFGALEIKDSSSKVSETTSDNAEDQTDDDIDLTCKEETPESPGDEDSPRGSAALKAKKSPKASRALPVSKVSPDLRPDEILCCQGCGCYAMAAEFEFLQDSACSRDCLGKIRQKRREKAKRERELLVQRQRREAKRKEKEKEREKMETEKKEKDVLKVKEDEEEKHVQEEMEEDLREIEERWTPKLSRGRNVQGHFNQMYPWYDMNRGFSWFRYLEHTNSKAAPSRIFPHARPGKIPCNFEVTMKMEAIDPDHPALICVVSISDIQGSRLRLHFDGYSYSYDFWENADSPNIFPSGFCASRGQRLEPPKGFKDRPFDWSSYLDETKCRPAIPDLFPDRPQLPDVSETWRIGMKLEAVDKHNASLVCVATVTNVLGGRILIHFDGWEMAYDYWIVPGVCPFIHPVGWCEKNGIELTPPKGYSNESFSWDRYLDVTGSVPLPLCAFQAVPKDSLFKVGMKLEALDKRNPLMIRVATVAAVEGRHVQIHYDGWSDEYNLWFEDSSPNLHPVSWCAQNDHPLMPPLTPEEIKFYQNRVASCPVRGCRSVGHVKGARFNTHMAENACPYASQNMHVEPPLPDRIQGLTIERSRQTLEEQQRSSSTQAVKIMEYTQGRRKRKNRKFFDDDSATPSDSSTSNLDPPLKKLQRSASGHGDPRAHEIRTTVFHGQNAIPTHPYLERLNWQENSNFLREKLAKFNPRNFARLNPQELVGVLGSVVPDLNPEFVSKIQEEEIDGEAFLLLTQGDFVQSMGFKLGPAVKLFNVVLLPLLPLTSSFLTSRFEPPLARAHRELDVKMISRHQIHKKRISLVSEAPSDW
eukprot:maker-scaffold101_size371023-snap-gene-1.12 protein:Tk03061 transcript:maker-scaffold101_size371023-snap-gene-1.12-mRNA-1 annotation:"lethal malignant brain tumor-like protein 3 isoform x2"